jgi:hypothetical protein
MSKRCVLCLCALLACAAALRLAPAEGRARGPADLDEKLKQLRAEIGYGALTGNAKKWWDAIEAENQGRKDLVLRLAEELAARRATINEFFLTYVYSDSDNIQANLHYLDYCRKLLRPDDFPAGVRGGEDADEEAVADLRREAGWEQTGGDARRWWGELEEAHRGDWRYLAAVLRELQRRKATIAELFLASVNGGGGMRASLDYLDYASYFAATPPRTVPEQTGGKASAPYFLREHPFRALRVPVRVYWASTESGFAGKNWGAAGDTEVEARLLRGYIDVLLRQADKTAASSDPVSDPQPVLQDWVKGASDRVDASPDDPFLLDLLAFALFANGKVEEAVKAADRGLDAAGRLPPSPRRDRAVRLLTRHRADIRAGLPDKVPDYAAAFDRKKPPKEKVPPK